MVIYLCCCSTSAQQMLHNVMLSAATTKFSDVPVLPIKIRFTSLKKKEENFETLKEITSGSQCQISSLVSQRREASEVPIRAWRTNSRAGPATLHKLHGKRVPLRVQWSPSFQTCHVRKRQRLNLPPLQMGNKRQVYTCADNNILFLKVTIKNTPFD